VPEYGNRGHFFNFDGMFLFSIREPSIAYSNHISKEYRGPNSLRENYRKFRWRRLIEVSQVHLSFQPFFPCPLAGQQLPRPSSPQETATRRKLDFELQIASAHFGVLRIPELQIGQRFLPHLSSYRYRQITQHSRFSSSQSTAHFPPYPSQQPFPP